MRIKTIIIFALIISILCLGGCGREPADPEDLLTRYTDCFAQADYTGMYDCISQDETLPDEDAFVGRYQTIFSAVSVESLSLEVEGLNYDYEEGTGTANLRADFTTGTVGDFTQVYTLPLIYDPETNKWTIRWSPSLIFPALKEAQKVIISRYSPLRGDIVDRTGLTLATTGNAYTVCAKMDVVPDKQAFAEALAPLLEMTPESILQKMEQPWVQPDSIVDLRVFSLNISEEYKARLLSVKGVLLDQTFKTNSRRYPCNDLFAHVIGYVTNVTAEDLETHPDYRDRDYIGKTGLESVYESRLFGQQGYRLSLQDTDGSILSVIAEQEARTGDTLTLSMDYELQKKAYQLLHASGFAGSVIALDPATGDVLAMVSSPAYEPNDFVNGILPSIWASLRDNADAPFVNRSVSALYPPGSTIKPFTAIMGLEQGIITPETVVKEANKEVWYPSPDWSAPPIRRVNHPAGQVDLDRALVWSDNIYFAWVAMRFSGDLYVQYAPRFGFGVPLPCDLHVSAAQIKNEGTSWSPSLLANTGYGQGEMLITPLQLACLYTCFYNKGTAMAPRLVHSIRTHEGEPVETKDTAVWLTGVVTEEQAALLQESMIRTVEETSGTGYGMGVEGLKLAAKTGTAQVNVETGDEIAWLVGYTVKEENPLLVCITLETPENEGGVKREIAHSLFEKFYGLTPEESPAPGEMDIVE
jgi:cell division protein FtsI/penicillin-binding protein 2